MPASKKTIFITQAHPDKGVERYRGFALAKLAKNHPVYVVGPPDYAFIMGYNSKITLTPFLYDPSTQSLDWPRLQKWMRQEKITGAYFMDYDDVLCAPPGALVEVRPGGFFIVQSSHYRVRKDNLGTHMLYGPLFVGVDVLSRFDLSGVICNHWMRWKIILEALRQGIAPQTVIADFVQLIFIDQPPYGSRRAHWLQMKSILALAAQIPDLPSKLGSCGEDFQKIADWFHRFSDADFINQVSVFEFCKRAILPLKNIFGTLLAGSATVLSAKSKPVSLKQVKSIGIIKLDNIGDALLMTPMLRQLRQHFKGEIRLLCSDQHYDLWQNCPEIERVLAVKKRHISDIYTARLSNQCFERDPDNRDGVSAKDEVVKYFANLAEAGEPFLRDCDVLLLPRGHADHYGGLNLACLTKARYRIMSRHYEGRDAKWNEGFEQNITHIVPRSPDHPHETDSMIELLQLLDIPVKFGPRQLYYWPSANDLSIVSLMYNPNLRKKQIVMAPGATVRFKMWPVDFFAETVTALASFLDYELVLIGAENEAAMGRHLAAVSPVKVHNLIGRLTLPQTISLLTRCQLLIGNCSSPVHMASAARIPCIHISSHAKSGNPAHGNSPLRFGPVGDKVSILQPDVTAGPPCVESCYANEAHCIKGITSPMVIAEIMKMLGISRSKAA